MSVLVRNGDRLVRKIRFKQEDFNRFAALSGDDNPIHTDPAFAAQTQFRRTICPDKLIYGVIVRLLEEEFRCFAQLEEELFFTAPVYESEEIEIEIELLKYLADDTQAELKVALRKASGMLAGEGNLMVRLPL